MYDDASKILLLTLLTTGMVNFISNFYDVFLFFIGMDIMLLIPLVSNRHFILNYVVLFFNVYFKQIFFFTFGTGILSRAVKFDLFNSLVIYYVLCMSVGFL
jgi:hypothetical protein